MGYDTSSPSEAVAEYEKEFHIFGSGISYSISPIIHNSGFQYHNLPYSYDIRESPSIDDVADLISASNFGGASVTMPHKLHAHKFCDKQSGTAIAIGAINTLIVSNENGKRQILGDNTDWSGLYSILLSYADKHEEPEIGLVIGAGGASRAALYSMYRAGVKRIYLANRTLSSAESIKDSFKNLFSIAVVPTVADLPERPDVIIGTVPANATTEDQFSGLFKTKGLCIDMAYMPRQTPLLTMAQKNKDWQTVTGLQVLLAQAYDQYRLWTGLEPPQKVMAEAVAAHELKIVSK
ncbi:shikimate [Kockiozyma suomiensis]|uniref:shikimate n=1 Tax=Kockiozyma suomiensis TaxID=1337062 RepID=UPI003343D032